MNRRYRVLIPKPVQKELDRLPNIIHDHIMTNLKSLEVDPRPSGCIKLKGRDAWRVRVGDYRIIYEINDEEHTVVLQRVGHRREIYR